MLVRFERGRNGDPIARLDGKVAFIGKSDPRRNQVKPGDLWEAEVTGQNKAGTCLFLRLTRSQAEIKAADEAAQRADAAKREAELAKWEAEREQRRIASLAVMARRQGELEGADKDELDYLLSRCRDEGPDAIGERIDSLKASIAARRQIALLWQTRTPSLHPHPGDRPADPGMPINIPYVLEERQVILDDEYGSSSNRPRHDFSAMVKVRVPDPVHWSASVKAIREWVLGATAGTTAETKAEAMLAGLEDRGWTVEDILSWIDHEIRPLIEQGISERVREWRRQYALYALSRTVDEGGVVVIGKAGPEWETRPYPGQVDQVSCRVISKAGVDIDRIGSWSELIEWLAEHSRLADIG